MKVIYRIERKSISTNQITTSYAFYEGDSKAIAIEGTKRFDTRSWKCINFEIYKEGSTEFNHVLQRMNEHGISVEWLHVENHEAQNTAHRRMRR